MKPSFALAPRLVVEQKRILLAEDDDEFRCFLADVLTDDGYEVITVRDGQGLLDRITRANSDQEGLDGIDLILSDVRMPHHDALEIIHGMRKVNIAVPILLMTAFGDRGTHDRATSLGALGVLNKPFDIDDLRTVVCNALAGHVTPTVIPANES